MGRLIRVGQWLRFRSGSGWNHAYVVSDEVAEDGTPLIIQATLRGVTGHAKLNDVAPGGSFTVLPLPPGVNPQMVLDFAKAQVGLEYGMFTILAIAIDIVTWNWFPAFRGSRRPSWICSALAGESLRFGGWLHSWIDIYTVTPSQLFESLNP